MSTSLSCRISPPRRTTPSNVPAHGNHATRGRAASSASTTQANAAATARMQHACTAGDCTFGKRRDVFLAHTPWAAQNAGSLKPDASPVTSASVTGRLKRPAYEESVASACVAEERFRASGIGTKEHGAVGVHSGGAGGVAVDPSRPGHDPL